MKFLSRICDRRFSRATDEVFVGTVAFGGEVDDFPAFGGVSVDAFDGAEETVFVDGFVSGAAGGDKNHGGGEKEILSHGKSSVLRVKII